MELYNQNSVSLSFDGIPVSPCDHDGMTYNAEGLTFTLKPDNNLIGLLCEHLGQSIPFQIEYLGQDCEGFKRILGMVFPEGTTGILQVEAINLKAQNPGITFTIAPE